MQIGYNAVDFLSFALVVVGPAAGAFLLAFCQSAENNNFGIANRMPIGIIRA